MIQQINSSEDFTVLRSALNLQATQACQAQYDENCNETIISQIYDQLVNGIATNYIETMKQTADQTAEPCVAWPIKLTVWASLQIITIIMQE